MPLDALGCAVFVGVDVRGRRRDRRHPSAAASLASAATFAPVPLNTGNASACSPKCARDDLLKPGRVDVLAVRDLVAAVRIGDRGEHLGVARRRSCRWRNRGN